MVKATAGVTGALALGAGSVTAEAAADTVKSEKVETGADLVVGVGGLASALEAGLVGGDVRMRLQDSPKVVTILGGGFPDAVVCLPPLI